MQLEGLCECLGLRRQMKPLQAADAPAQEHLHKLLGTRRHQPQRLGDTRCGRPGALDAQREHRRRVVAGESLPSQRLEVCPEGAQCIQREL